MLLLAPVLSGFAALIWQIVWVRELGLVFGGTTEAVALTTAIFLAGTGVGARVAGESGRGARAYALCEGVVAAWGVLSWPLLVWLAARGVGGAALGSDGWWMPSFGARASQLVLTVSLLAVPTLAMGASLPLLATRVLPTRTVGWRLGALAALNTSGAALGTFSCDLLLIPAFGLQGAGWLAGACGLAAATLAWLAPRSTAAAEAASAVTPLPAWIPALLAGFAAMGLELLWFRFLGSALGPYRAVYSLLLTVLLVGWAAGAALGGHLAHRLAPAPLLAYAQGGVACLALAGLSAHDSRSLLIRQLASHDRLDLHVVNLWTVTTVVLAPALAMGIAFSALAAVAPTRAGQWAGRLWLATAFGNAAGALLTGLALLPALGMTRTAALLAGLAAVAPLSARGLGIGPYGRGACVGALALTCLYATLPADYLVWASFPYGRADEEGVLAVEEGLDETIVVTGDPAGPARLWTNGHPMSATTPRGQRYMRLMAHVGLLGNPTATDALIICFGVGNTLHAASMHPLARLTLADTSLGVLSQSGWFEHANHGVLQDPRVRVMVDDGRHVLHGFEPASLDFVTLEPPPLAHAGVSSLYTREFYELARQRLRTRGWITQWLPAYQVSASTVRALIGAFIEVFPDSVLLVGAGRELILVGVKGGSPTLDAATIRATLARGGPLADDLTTIGITSPEDLAATFAAGPDRLRAVAGRAMTDDRPVSEWSEVSHVARTHLPDGLLDPAGWERFVVGARLTDEVVHANRAAWTAAEFTAFTNVP